MTNIEQNVMRRVRRIRILYAVFSGAAAACLLFVLSLWGIGREVWVAAVFDNGPHDFWGHTGYLWYAFLHTNILVQLLSAVVIASVIYVAYEAAKFISGTFVPLQA